MNLESIRSGKVKSILQFSIPSIIAMVLTSLGGGDTQKCRSVFNQTICTALVLTVPLGVVVWLCFGPMLAFLHADVQVAGYFRDYYGIILWQLPDMVLNSSLGMRHACVHPFFLYQESKGLPVRTVFLFKGRVFQHAI